MELRWHGYTYYPYERDLGLREVASLVGPVSQRNTLLGPLPPQEDRECVKVEEPISAEAAKRLVYFAQVMHDDNSSLPTEQALLERFNGHGKRKQSTRYSSHGLHEYKGKFNPQIAKAILNIFGIQRGQVAIDPFCGSGTALVECAHLGIRSIGTDINPLAVFLANAKLTALGIPAVLVESEANLAIHHAAEMQRIAIPHNERKSYLESWFAPEILEQIEALRIAIENSRNERACSVLLALASNLLREFSLQEPSDLRIRRRRSPLPQRPFLDAFKEAVVDFVNRLKVAQSVLGVSEPQGKAILFDSKQLAPDLSFAEESFDIAITSPPYATALPYIDTQRLSLVWLNLLSPSQILDLEAELIGSRETRGQSKQWLLSMLRSNVFGIPDAEAGFCVRLQNALTPNDGFRRQGVPRLLYRYFSDMSQVFRSVRTIVKQRSPFALIVGRNHTVLGGKRYDIDTPKHLENIAVHCGWHHIETISLQTYHRYGLHMNNATTSEALMVLKA